MSHKFKYIYILYNIYYVPVTALCAVTIKKIMTIKRNWICDLPSRNSTLGQLQCEEIQDYIIHAKDNVECKCIVLERI